MLKYVYKWSFDCLLCIITVVYVHDNHSLHWFCFFFNFPWPSINCQYLIRQLEKSIIDWDNQPSVAALLPVNELTSKLYLIQIILLQEKEIQRLNELVQSLRKRLLQCRSSNNGRNSSLTTFTEHVIELERQQTLED